MSTVIGVCGFSGAGKTTFCVEMARRFPLPVLSTGDVVRRRIAERGDALTPESVARVSDEIGQETGHRFVRVLAPELIRNFRNTPAVFLDCLREESDLAALRDLSYHVTLVGITARDEVRAARARGRARPGDPMTADGLRSLDERERRLGVDRLVASADFRIANDDDLEAFIARSIAVLGDITPTLASRKTPHRPAGCSG